VWLAYCIKTKSFVAAKVHNKCDYKIAKDEIELEKQFSSSDSLSYIIDSFTVKRVVVIIMPLMACSLYDLMKAKYPKGLTLDLMASIEKQIFSQVSELHSQFNILHCDLKPENIMLKGTSPKCTRIIKQFNEKGGLEYYRNKTASIEEACGMMISEILLEHDYNMKSIVAYTSSNEESDSDDSDCESESDRESNDESESDHESNDDSESDHESNDDSDSDHESNDESDDNEASDISVYEPDSLNNINSSLIENPVIILVDYGNALFLNDKESDVCQTRYYRSPLVILERPIKKSMDWWSVGCLLYELQTSKILFDPPAIDESLWSNSLETNRDIPHLYMISNIKRIPKTIISKSKIKKLRICKQHIDFQYDEQIVKQFDKYFIF